MITVIFSLSGVPGTPTGFNYTDRTSNTVTVIWIPLSLSGVMYIFEYEVEGRTISRNITDGSTEQVASGLQPDTVYEFVISSYKDGKRSLPARIQVRTVVAGLLKTIQLIVF